MELELLKQLPNLGVGVAAVIVILLIVKAALEHLSNSHKAFQAYVTENNHKTTEILVQARDNIAESTRVLIQVGESMKQVTAHLIAERSGGRRK